jgi:uncharacterized Tic20 family protein
MSQPAQYPPSGQPFQPQNSPDQMRGQQLAQTSMILGILSLFVFGVILGPIAIVKAKQAERLNTAATVGKVTGWIGTIIGVLSILGFVIFTVLLMTTSGSTSP